MEKETQEFFADMYDKAVKETDWTDGLIRLPHGGHTAETAPLAHCHDGRATASFYALAAASGRMDAQEGTRILAALQSLQIIDGGDPFCGCFRWYREETRVNDSNAAFFIVFPLAVARLLYTESIPAGHVGLIDGMLERGAVWFSKECRRPALYYTNKAVSDGALLLAISSLSRHRETYEIAVRFFELWEDYTGRRGWGWGENISLTYLGVILNSLRLACRALGSGQAALMDKLEKRIDGIWETVRFHGGHEFIPTVRSYNSNGTPDRKSPLWLLAGIRGDIEEEISPDPKARFWEMTTLLLHAEKIPGIRRNAPSPENRSRETPRSRKEHIFDGACATTWVGRHGRLGSINRFPFMPGCYQWPSWGLGWQSYPAAFCLNGEPIAYMRWAVKEGENLRTHPAGFADGYLNPALFGEEHYPKVETRCAQRMNALLAVRSMSGLCNRASEITDEWYMDSFSGAIETYCTEPPASPRTWVILWSARSAVALTALRGIQSKSGGYTDMEIAVRKTKNHVCLGQVLCGGAEAVLHDPKLEAGWALLFLDGPVDENEAHRILDGAWITDEILHDCEVPRAIYQQARNTAMKTGADEEISLIIDPI